MARHAVRLLCLAIVLAAVLFHPDAAVEGKDRRKPEGVVCSSPFNKVPAIGEIIGIAKDVCKKVEDDVQGIEAEDVCKKVEDDVPGIEVDDVQLVFEDEKRHRDEKCRKKLKDGLLEAMKHYKGLKKFIYCTRPSIQQLKNFICEESPSSTEDNESKSVTMIKNISSKVKKLPWSFLNLLQKEKPPNPAKACKKLKSFPDVKFYMTF